eukprot:scaffold48748_cov47-Attheya_sp.AAC.1
MDLQAILDDSESDGSSSSGNGEMRQIAQERPSVTQMSRASPVSSPSSSSWRESSQSTTPRNSSTSRFGRQQAMDLERILRESDDDDDDDDDDNDNDDEYEDYDEAPLNRHPSMGGGEYPRHRRIVSSSYSYSYTPRHWSSRPPGGRVWGDGIRIIGKVQ